MRVRTRDVENGTPTPATALSTHVHTTRTDPTAARWSAVPSATQIPVPSVSTSKLTATPSRQVPSRRSQPAILRPLPLQEPELIWCCPGPHWLSCMPLQGHSWHSVPHHLISPCLQGTRGQRLCSVITSWLQGWARHLSSTLYCFHRLGWRLNKGS